MEYCKKHEEIKQKGIWREGKELKEPIKDSGEGRTVNVRKDWKQSGKRN